MRILILLFVFISSTSFAEAACLVSPTDKKQVSGRFGKFRGGGAANFGSGNSNPHMHDGLDFSTSGKHAKIMATAAGTVTWAKRRGTAGNTVMIERPNGDIMGYYHLLNILVKRGQEVSQGDVIGQAGRSGMKPSGAIHLHYIYATQNKTDVRANAFSAAAVKNPAFNPAQLPNVIRKKDFGYATDPSPYFCESFPIQNDGLHGILGADTMAQYNFLNGNPSGNVSIAEGYDDTQISAGNNDAVQAVNKGATTANIATVMHDEDGYGSLPTPPIGDYETLSPAEMMSTEAGRRFSDDEWNKNVVTVGMRALWVDYVRATGLSIYMDELIRKKKEKIESLLATYTSMKLTKLKTQTQESQRDVSSKHTKRLIN